MNNPNFNPRIEVNCPICNSKRFVQYANYQDWELVFCGQDNDRPEHCDTPFVVKFDVENIKESGRVGKIISARSLIVGGVKPARRRYEVSGGFYEAIYPFQVSELRHTANAFYYANRQQYPRLEKVEFVENVTNEVYWAIGTKAALWYQFAPEIPLTDEMTAALTEKGFSLLDNQANVIAYERWAGTDKYRIWFYADKIMTQFRTTTFEPNEKHSYTNHDFTYADWRAALEWFANPQAEAYFKGDGLDQTILEFLRNMDRSLKRPIGLDEIIEWIGIDGRFAITETSENVVKIRLNRMIGAGLVTREGDYYRTAAKPGTKQILDNLMRDEPPASEAAESPTVFEPTTEKPVECTNCGRAVLVDKNHSDFPLLKCENCSKEFTFYQAKPFVPLEQHLHVCPDCAEQYFHIGKQSECPYGYEFSCSASNLDCKIKGRSLNMPPVEKPAEENGCPLTDNQQIKFNIICNYIDWFSTDEGEREVMKNGALQYVSEDHVDEIGGQE